MEKAGCGLVLAGMLGQAILGAGIYGIIMTAVGAAIIAGKLLYWRKLDKQAASWRAAYPAYKYDR